MDELAAQLGIDPLEFRARNALRAGDATADRPGLAASAGLPACLDALRPALGGHARRGGSRQRRPRDGRIRRGVGIGCHVVRHRQHRRSPNPSTIEVGIRADGTRRPVLRARSTSARARTRSSPRSPPTRSACPVASIERVGPDTDLTPDAGKTSASRQTFVSGNATRLAARGPAPPDPDARRGRRRTRRWRSTAGGWRRGTARRSRSWSCGELPVAAPRLRAARARHLRPADHAARRRRPGRPVRDLRLRRADRRGRGRPRPRHRQGAPDRRRPRRRPGDQPDAGRGPDPGRHRAGARAWR